MAANNFFAAQCHFFIVDIDFPTVRIDFFIERNGFLLVDTGFGCSVIRYLPGYQLSRTRVLAKSCCSSVAGVFACTQHQPRRAAFFMNINSGEIRGLLYMNLVFSIAAPKKSNGVLLSLRIPTAVKKLSKPEY